MRKTDIGQTFPSKVKILKSDTQVVLFDSRDLTLRVLLRENAERSCLDGTATKALDQELVLSNILPQGCSSDESCGKDVQKQGFSPVLHKLTLNVSNICNMKCVYCYANSGKYYTDGIQMNQNLALRAINVVTRKYSAVDSVVFFGGEPTLNHEILELICEYFLYLHKRRILPYVPEFGMTTNALHLSARTLDTILKYSIRVTVSIDGPPEIHDRLRVSEQGTPTYELIKKNVDTLFDSGILPEFECTYTSEHSRLGIDIVELMDFFAETFTCRTLHCPIVAVNQGSPWYVPLEKATQIQANAIRYSVRNLALGIPRLFSVTTRLLNILATKEMICHYCPAVDSAMTINADGNVYPCFMLMERSDLRLGNVNDERFSMEMSPSLAGVLAGADKEANQACSGCWAKPLCFGCIGEDIARSGATIQRSAFDGKSDVCDHRRTLIEVFLLSVADALSVAPESEQDGL
jgi:uncharacterized protein